MQTCLSNNLLLVGLDVGTSSVKANVYTSRGENLSSIKKPITRNTSSGNMFEQDPVEILQSVKEAIDTILRKFKDSCLYIGLSSTSPSLIPIDEEGNPLSNVIGWMDRRATDEVVLIENALGRETIVRKTGLYSDPIFTAPKILWLKNNINTVYRKARYFIQIKDFIFYHLTGQPYTDYSHISETLLYTLNGKWYWDMLEILGITPESLFTPLPSKTVFELIPSRFLKELGEHRKRVYVVLGGVDSVVSTLGMGAIKEHIAADTTGTSTCINVTLKEPIERLIGIFETYRHVIEDHYILEASLPTSGILLDKILELTGLDYSVLNTIDETPSSLIVLPFMAGTRSPDWNPRLRGSIYGLTPEVSKHDLIKAAIEGVAYWIRSILEILSENGIIITEIRCGGGGRGLWSTIKANVTGVKYVELVESETTSLGAAMLAGIGAGVFKNYEEAVSSMVKISKVYIPSSKYTGIYSSMYRTWLNIWKALKSSIG